MSSYTIPHDDNCYNEYVERMRRREYPMLKDALYLDHAGTTLYSKTLMERFHQDMMTSLYGNPHSLSPSSQRSTQNIEDVRLELLRFFNADADRFDLVFTSNATAAAKLVGDAFSNIEDGFHYGYHIDSHTSLVGLREHASSHVCLESENDMRTFIEGGVDTNKTDQCIRPMLITYPAQSNMNGRRLPLSWCHRTNLTNKIRREYILLDAASYISTSPLDLSNMDEAPDFTVLSLYKIFGFPDLGALIVRKDAAHLFEHRRYFGGGTVDMVVCLKEQWHAKKTGTLHERIEDGTLPIHSILATKHALQTHRELFGTLDRISKHTANLAKSLYDGLSSLRHNNGIPVCSIYKAQNSFYGDTATQGPIVAFNLRDSRGDWVSTTEIEKLAAIKDIHLRTGGVCNPGGIASALSLSPWEMRENLSAGHRCGGENDILDGKPTGVVRLSLGAMSTYADVERLTAFITEFFVDRSSQACGSPLPIIRTTSSRFYVESLTVYPIKSCGGWQVPEGQSWEVRAEGLVWDREWCVVHQSTGKALSQKQYPAMALLRPRLDFKAGQLLVGVTGCRDEIRVPLSRNPSLYASFVRDTTAIVCDDPTEAHVYVSHSIADFFTKAIGTACTLARHNPASRHGRHCKADLRTSKRHATATIVRPILLSNESPILTISRSSLNRLNEQIKAKGGKAAHPSVFRANIVLAESPLLPPGQEQPWAEDHWHGMRVGSTEGPIFEFLSGCRRCQMVCVDQDTAKKNAEPFTTLAKTRRHNGRVLFGVHTSLAKRGGQYASIRVGDVVETFNERGRLDV